MRARPSTASPRSANTTSDRAEGRRPDEPPAGAYFDGRAARYDEAAIHHRVAARLVAGADLRPGQRVLDIATGTAIAALQAARLVGPDGLVLGLDLSARMLDAARRKRDAAALRQVLLLRADAERPPVAEGGFDRLLAASALALMTDRAGALRSWRALLVPGGLMAFDMPGTPFGLAGRLARAAARHGVDLPYATEARTAARCRALLGRALLEPVAIRRLVADDAPIPLADAALFLDAHLDHPAWRPLRDAPSAARAAIRAAYDDALRADAAADGRVPARTALNLVLARRPS